MTWRRVLTSSRLHFYEFPDSAKPMCGRPMTFSKVAVHGNAPKCRICMYLLKRTTPTTCRHNLVPTVWMWTGANGVRHQGPGPKVCSKCYGRPVTATQPSSNARLFWIEGGTFRPVDEGLT